LTAFPPDAGTFLDGFHRAWSDRGFGGPVGTGPGVLLAALSVLVTGGAADLGQYVYMSAWIPMAFAGMVYLCRRWLAVGWALALMGGVIYVTTPVAIGLAITGATGLLWAYALVPFVLATAEKVRVEGFRAVGPFAAAVALLAAFNGELLMFGFLIAAIWIVIGAGRRRVFPAMVVALAVATIAALPGLVGRAEIQPSERLIQKALADLDYTYAKASLATLVRLAGNQGDPMHLLGYDGAAAWTFAGFLLALLFIFGLVCTRIKDSLALRLGVLAVAALYGLLAIKVLAARRPEFLEGLPGLLVFRNPEKIMILLSVALVAGAMYGASALVQLSRVRRRLTSVAVLCALALYLGLYARPAFSGHWGVKTVRGDAYVADRELLAAARYLSRIDPSLPGTWRVAWIPFSAADVLSLEWVLPEWSNDPVLESRDPEVEETTEILEKAIDVGDMDRFHSIADRSAVRYLVVRANADADTVRAIRTDPRLQRIHTERGFEIWRNRAALARIRPFSGITTVITGRRGPPVGFTSQSIVRLGADALRPRTRWTVYPRPAFAWTGTAIRIRGTGAVNWPVLARRVRIFAKTSYAIDALVRTRHAAAAHVKVIWYGSRRDLESQALRQDYVGHELTGDHGWTRIAGIVQSPPHARFGEVAFLAGKRPVEDREPGLSWIAKLEMAPYFRGRTTPTGPEILAEVGDVGPRNYEVADAASLDDRVSSHVNVAAVVINPAPEGRNPKATSLLRRVDRLTIVAQGGVALQPRSGVWRNTAQFAQLASVRGEASLPLGRVPAREYAVSLIGCRLGSTSIRIVTRSRTLLPRVSRDAGRCGRVRTTEPVALAGRTEVHVDAVRGASIARVEVRSGTLPRDPNAGSTQPTITAANSTAPTVQDLSSSGLSLADAFHPGWRPSGTSGYHFRTLLGFNGFVIDHPSALTGLSYGPQRTRDLLLLLSLIGWLVIGLLVLFAPRARHASVPGGGRSA
jgi:hypothetical protein